MYSKISAGLTYISINAFRICSMVPEEFAVRVGWQILWVFVIAVGFLLRTDGDLCFRRTDYVVRPSTGEEKRVFQEQVRR